MPRDTKCSHRNCFGEPCKQLTQEELTPEPRHFETARKLVAEGYVQVSRKYRTVARVKPEIPRDFDDIFRAMPRWDDFKPEEHVEAMRRAWKAHLSRLLTDNRYSEKLRLTVKEFEAFLQVAREQRGMSGNLFAKENSR